jgi:hypothetical protein
LERGLVQPERLHAGEPGGIVDAWVAMLADRTHRGAPADTELARGRGDRGAVLADLAADLRARSRGQRGPDVVRDMLSSAPPLVRALLPRIAPRAYARYCRRVHAAPNPSTDETRPGASRS